MSATWRLGILGIAFMALFAVLSLRMWQLQVTEAAVYEGQAESNQIDLASTPAPRGQIFDAEGRLIAGTRPALAAIVDGQLVPADVQEELVARLSAFAGLGSAEVAAVVEDARDRGDRVPLVAELTDDQAVFLVEHAEEFPGVTVEPQPIRVYPQAELASDIVGFIGKPTQSDVDSGANPTELVGRAGVERTYDELLRGTPGRIKYLVDARRNVLNLLNEEAPRAGNSLELTIDLDVQTVLEATLAEGLQVARDEYDPNCEPGEDDPGCPVRAVGVVMGADTGELLAIASVPTYDPNMFVEGVTEADLAILPDGVLSNFAIQGQYAPASTFKATTFVTSLEEQVYPRGEASAQTRIICKGQLDASFTDASRLVWRNWTRGDDGEVNLDEAFTKSCNTYFWDVALNIWEQHKETPRENMLQEWARGVGFGELTGVDLPFERSGIVPDRELFEQWGTEQAAGGPPRLDPARLELATPWLGGDLLQAAVGQGAVLATPLQLAVAYAAMTNGGKVYEPHVVSRVVDSDGVVIQENVPTVVRDVGIDPTTTLALRRAMGSVVNNPEGTAYEAFVDFGAGSSRVGGKTGTAQIIRGVEPTETDEGRDPVSTALFVGVAPLSSPRYVVVVVVERGGSGGRIAAAAAKPVFQYLLNGEGAQTAVIPGQDSER